jgi:hypothetical protein
MADARIDVVIGSGQAQSGANAVNRAVNSVKTNFLDLSAKVFVVQRAMTRLWGMASGAAQFEETLGRLNRQMGAWNSTAQLMVNSLQTVTQHQLSAAQAATMASRALALGLNPDQVRTFTQAADALGDVLGTSIPAAFDQIVQGAITGHAQILGNIGVYVDLEAEVRKLAVSTGRTTEQITKQERAMLAAKAITEQAGDAMRKLTDGAVSDADRLRAVEARWEDLWTTIGQGAKRTVIDVLDAWGTLKKVLEPEESGFSQLRRFLKRFDPQAQDDAVWQEVLGRAIVQDTQGNLGRPPQRVPQPVPGLPTALQGKQLDAERERVSQALQGDFDRMKARFDAIGQLYELDVQRQILSQEEVVQLKGTLRLQELAKQGETLNRQIELEKAFHDRRVKMGFESTEERIQEDERYRSKVFEINQSILSNVAAFGVAQERNEAERALARGVAESALGQRVAEDAKAQFDIREAWRQRDFDATQTYYQGELEMAHARFASDEEIARKERELLRAQLAFKLRLTEEETNQLLILRQSHHFEGVRDILGRADPMLPPTAREGILESGAAKDIELRERATGDFFAGWTRGLQKYVRDTESSFGFAQDMARRTAQAMEQSFQRFFFDSLDGKFRSFKDVLAGVLDFTKQIVSQIAGQLVMMGIVKPGASALSGLFGSLGGGGTTAVAAHDYSGVNFPKFASGGTGNFGAGTPVLLHGIEAAVPLPDGRSIPVTLRYPTAMPTGQAVAVSVPVTIVNQHEGAKIETRQSTGANGMPQLEVLVTKLLNQTMADGRMDHTMKARFGLTPGER